MPTVKPREAAAALADYTIGHKLSWASGLWERCWPSRASSLADYHQVRAEFMASSWGRHPELPFAEKCLGDGEQHGEAALASATDDEIRFGSRLSPLERRRAQQPEGPLGSGRHGDAFHICHHRMPSRMIAKARISAVSIWSRCIRLRWSFQCTRVAMSYLLS